MKWSTSTKQLQEVHEDHYDVDVEYHGAEDVVVDAEAVAALTQDELGVEDEVEAEEEDTEGAQQHLEEVAVEEDGEDREHHECHTQHPDKAHLPREVRLRGPGVRRHRRYNTDGHGEGHTHRPVSVRVETVRVAVVGIVLAEPGDEVALTEGEEEKNDVVGWDGPRELAIADEGDLQDDG